VPLHVVHNPLAADQGLQRGVVLGVTLASAVWLYTYRVWTLVEYIGRDGREFHASERVMVTPWWGVPATVALIFVGVGTSLWLLPGHRGLIRRFADHFGNPSTPKSNSTV
jgi:hypothetical protein